jgi:hypothetical protein
MLPNVYEQLRTNATIVSLVNKRIYRHGAAPQDVAKPYITWSVSMNMPQDVLNAQPCHDKDTVQIDCWSETDQEIENLAYAVRAALDSTLISNRIMLDTRENDTKLYRISIEADFIRSR